jgi:hypothetical protein
VGCPASLATIWVARLRNSPVPSGKHASSSPIRHLWCSKMVLIFPWNRPFKMSPQLMCPGEQRMSSPCAVTQQGIRWRQFSQSQTLRPRYIKTDEQERRYRPQRRRPFIGETSLTFVGFIVCRQHWYNNSHLFITIEAGGFYSHHTLTVWTDCPKKELTDLVRLGVSQPSPPCRSRYINPETSCRH